VLELVLTPIDFYFDFISPFAYLAANRIEVLARRHSRVVHWRPFRLGVAVVKVMGLKPLMETPLKSEYSTRDLARLATLLGDPLTASIKVPDPIPPARLFYGAPAEKAGELAKALFRACYVQGLDIGATEVLLDVAAEVGIHSDVTRHALSDPQTKGMLRDATQAAIAHGVFGSPTCRVGKELFWGVDRLWLLDQYLGAGERYERLDSSVAVELGFE
jgi:2-hydroxychromene-2-carboxylate isomerase